MTKDFYHVSYLRYEFVFIYHVFFLCGFISTIYTIHVCYQCVSMSNFIMLIWKIYIYNLLVGFKWFVIIFQLTYTEWLNWSFHYLKLAFIINYIKSNIECHLKKFKLDKTLIFQNNIMFFLIIIYFINRLIYYHFSQCVFQISCKSIKHEYIVWLNTWHKIKSQSHADVIKQNEKLGLPFNILWKFFLISLHAFKNNTYI